jgi:iron(III) transport system permease protein
VRRRIARLRDSGKPRQVDAAMRSLFVLAYTIRFLAAALGAVETGLTKISRHTDAAARTLGATITDTLWRVHLPLLRPALGAAALLVFVDSMKELPATLLLRPFNFDTLATQVFTLAGIRR